MALTKEQMKKLEDHNISLTEEEMNKLESMAKQKELSDNTLENIGGGLEISPTLEKAAVILGIIGLTLAGGYGAYRYKTGGARKPGEESEKKEKTEGTPGTEATAQPVQSVKDPNAPASTSGAQQ